ncbi:MAG: hypothetical protein LOD91_10265, partial [Limnochordales bacterium]
MRFGLWMVALHNSTLGDRHPELVQRYVFGDRYRYGLCPAHPRVRAYARALLRDAIDQLQPDSVALESPTYLGAIHGEHHELILLNMDRVTEFLLGLCFCDSCRARAQEQGIDPAAVQATVAAAVRFLLEEERGALDVAFRQQEVAAFLVEHPEVYAYVRARLATVKGLLEELHQIAQRAGVTLETTSSIFARPITRAWEEGTGLRETAQAVDSVSIVAYHQTPDEVRADVRWFKLMCPDKPFTLALNAGHPNALSADDLAQKAAVAAQEGARAVAYYNYGLLTHRRLEWVARANAVLKGL